ncbi:PulJ/GspJ family protein [Dermatobacter hominis]|uniref:PulJ/GspJ family protein n=1 Tax=Dermatobacter hominis TaxID=2884263 RepID=UPI001D128BE5|nr:prepilin-type N-terminal cleavage/methylation domain-containing protein [Dermatobacter hominis]UDY37957.1 PKD domain-containing protein [Dermatobacter hominis]
MTRRIAAGPAVARFVERRRRKGQAGITLMEILIALAIASLLVVPLGAWTFGTLRAGFVTQDELGQANATGLLNTYFLRDVASARAFVTPAGGVTNCAGATSQRPLVRLIQSGDVTTSVVYAVGLGPDPVALLRNTCAPNGDLVDSVEVMTRVQGSGAGADCLTAAGTTIACDQPDAVRARMTVPKLHNDGTVVPLVVSGTRRTTGAGTGFAQSNPPFAGFTLSPGDRGYTTTEFTATSTSTDPDGDDLTLTWSFPADADVIGMSPDRKTVRFRLPNPGDVGLTASDGSNATNGSKSIDIIKRPPIVSADTACTLVSGRTFALVGSASDPDGDAVTVAWVDPTGAPIVGPQWTAPDGATGGQTLTFTATDDTGRTSVQTVSCYVAAPVDEGITISPTPTPGGVVNAVPPNGSLEVSFKAVNPGASVIDWLLYVKGSPTPVNSVSATDPWKLPFLSSEEGEYEIVRVTDGVPGQRVGFRVNVQPAVTLAVTSQNGAVPTFTVGFASSATDSGAGSVVATTWDFGDGTVIDAPAGDVSHTYVAPGTYTVRFRAIDNDGGVGEAVLPLVVAPAGGG